MEHQLHVTVKFLSHPGHLGVEGLTSSNWTSSCGIEDVLPFR